jgi:hypothetical protein
MRPTLFSSVSTSVVVSAALVAACGGAPPPPPPEPPHAEAPVQHPSRPVLKTRSELGSIDPAAVKKAFTALDGAFMDCQKHALGRVEVLSGSAKFFLRVGEDGSAKYAYLEDSELGDRDTEKCLLDAVTGASWPRPDGGEAEVRYGMELPLQATRPANDWASEKVTSALAKHGEAIDRCKAGAAGTFRATMYVGTGGKVLAAGVAASTRDAAGKADCLSEALVKMKGLPSPGSWPAKVSFGL